MTLSDAGIEAKNRWGPVGLAIRAREPKRADRFQVGIAIVRGLSVKGFGCHGKGPTWEAAFQDADKNQAVANG